MPSQWRSVLNLKLPRANNLPFTTSVKLKRFSSPMKNLTSSKSDEENVNDESITTSSDSETENSSVEMLLHRDYLGHNFR